MKEEIIICDVCNKRGLGKSYVALHIMESIKHRTEEINRKFKDFRNVFLAKFVSKQDESIVKDFCLAWEEWYKEKYLDVFKETSPNKEKRLTEVEK